jgi:GNAT superfamily N-acetyltransferase
MRRIRLLTTADVPAALELSAAAGWNQTPADWERMIGLEPSGCFGVQEDGRLVATTTLLTYGRELAWVGMVLTHSEYQRRGYAGQLVTAALELAAARGVRCVKLDATDQGQPLYARLGFEEEQPIERWCRLPGSISTDAKIETGTAPMEVDHVAFGVDRSRFLKTLSSPLVLDGSYAFHRPGARAHYVGPCISREAALAKQLIAATVATNVDVMWYMDILPANESAIAIGRDLGFQPARRLVRMVRGENVRGDERLIYAIAGFEAG